LILADYRLESRLFLLFLLQFHFWAFLMVLGESEKTNTKTNTASIFALFLASSRCGFPAPRFYMV